MSIVAGAPLPIQRFWDVGGRPISKGRLYHYVAGTSRLAEAVVYRDYALTVPWENPILLTDESWPGGAGYVPGAIFVPTTLAIKWILTGPAILDAHPLGTPSYNTYFGPAVQQWSVDNVPPNVGGDQPPSVWQDWVPTWLNTGTPNVLADGTLTGRYRFWGRTTISVQLFFQWGSGTVSGSGSWIFGNFPLPADAVTIVPRSLLVQTYTLATSFMQGAGLYIQPEPRTKVEVWKTGVFGAYAPERYSGTVPAVWQAGDYFVLCGDYEVARLGGP